MQSPRDLGLPFDEWRPGQQLAIRTGLHAKTKHTVIQAPTGAGKSAIAAGIMAQDERRHGLLTATKGLEDQYGSYLESLADIRGMSNYRCLAADDQFRKLFELRKGRIGCDEGPCRSGSTCGLKDDGCLYFDARREALASRTMLTNYAYWLAMRRFGGGLGPVYRLMCDEAHDLLDQLMSASRIEIPASLVDGNYPHTAKAWRLWAAHRYEELKPRPDEPEDKRVRKAKLAEALEQLTKIDASWAWDDTEHHVVFEPTVPRLLFPTLAGKEIAKVVYLSATITPGTLRMLDIPDEDVTFQVMKSRFDVRRRPVYLLETVRVDHRMQDEHRAYWINRIDRIISERLDRKGIIHTVSYRRAQEIYAASKHKAAMIVPRSGRELAAALQKLRSSVPPAILLSPSVTTGFDFPGQDAEYQIVAKMPFPDTRSRITKARIKATPGYRDHLTMQTLVQACGRLMRGAEDQSETFIVDDHARWALPKAWKEGLLPAWFWEAVRFEKRVVPPPPPLNKERE